MIEVAVITLGLVALGAMGVAVFAIREYRVSSQQAGDRTQALATDAIAKVRATAETAFDRLQSRTLTETVEAERLRAENQVNVANLRDALAKTDPRYGAKPNGKLMLHTVDGKEFPADEIESL